MKDLRNSGKGNASSVLLFFFCAIGLLNVQQLAFQPITTPELKVQPQKQQEKLLKEVELLRESISSLKLLLEERGGKPTPPAAAAMADTDRQQRSARVCGNHKEDSAWGALCARGFIDEMDRIVAKQRIARIVQIGAHVGFERNDPLGKGMMSYLDLLSEEEKKLVQWTFVEPSPANYEQLQTTIAAHAAIADLRSKNVAVVSDNLPANETQGMTFYSISEDIDPVSGYDKRSGKQFPYWITQISSFSMDHIKGAGRLWKKMGLKVEDYVVHTNVTTMRYSDLLQEVLQGDDPAESLALVLIDTEGFDCHIVNGISAESIYVPGFLLYEHKSCKRDDKQLTLSHLARMGFAARSVGDENTLAWKLHGSTVD